MILLQIRTSVLAFAFLVRLLIREDDEQQEVDEKFEPMHDVVAVTGTTFLHDHLGVVHDEATHHEEQDVQVGLGQKIRPYKYVEQAETEESDQDGEEGAP